MRRAEVALQSFYGVSALAQVANESRYVMNKLLRLVHVRFQSVGRSVLVPLSEIEEKVPLLWNSLQVLERVRRAAQRAEGKSGPALQRGSTHQQQPGKGVRL
jgi:hypothetical protein